MTDPFAISSDLMVKPFESIKRGLVEATEHARGRQAGVTFSKPVVVDVAAVRGRLGFTQAQFAARFGFSVATLRHWGARTAARRALRWCC